MALLSSLLIILLEDVLVLSDVLMLLGEVFCKLEDGSTKLLSLVQQRACFCNI